MVKFIREATRNYARDWVYCIDVNMDSKNAKQLSYEGFAIGPNDVA